MKSLLIRRLLAASMLTIASAGSAASADPAPRPGTYEGPATELGKGTARTFVVIGEDGAPTQLGVGLSDTVMDGIEHSPNLMLTLPLPAEAKATGFDHVLLDWNSHGHQPTELYGAPHFDVHFYWIDVKKRLAVNPGDPDYMAKGARYPAAEFVPVDHVPPPHPDPVPEMGTHWVDVTSPEFNGQPFTHTFIYGSWDGEFTFVEPMLTKAFLDTRAAATAPVKQPARFAKPGYYPTSYRIDFDPERREHRIVLESLTKR